ncbi:ABC transporter permease [Altererythrobacter sp. CC-YST694]|uniref:MlaE family ABC transporter permease n=1 Tax=Altererythrobacter sp. CC-YST694 TaxID=2755038 RepID=UPI001D030E5C|nr:ABC transporter permease [Altererythrobacter sp. CC-YST694]MCB5426208.1 ABC transporter permease [Altererythrobacter sp. CC-YST694]
MREWADFTVETDDKGGTRLVLAGPLLISSIGVIDRKLRDWQGPVDQIDLAEAGPVDTVGAWIVWRFARETKAQITGASEDAQRLIEAVQGAQGEGTVEPPRLPFITRVPAAVGTRVYNWGLGVVKLLGFLGAILMAFGSLLAHPRRLRIASITRQFELVGVSALGIIGLMSVLIGIVIAQQGAVQLRQFGAEIYTVNLTGRLAVRELGVLMTAIMVAGRSGSAFAAQIGTMKLTEEVDAMRTIGVSPLEALILPRLIAAVLMMPLLGFFSAGLAIIGGAIVSDLTLGIPFFTFLSRIQEVVPLHDVWVCMVKAPVFGLIVALAGCYQGMQVRGNSEEVGLRTTMAVVQGIFMVIVLDAFFAVFFTEVGWG